MTDVLISIKEIQSMRREIENLREALGRLDGTYVPVADYEAIRSENKELRKTITRLILQIPLNGEATND